MFLTEINIALKCSIKHHFALDAVIIWPHFTLKMLVSVLISLISTTIIHARYIVITRQVPPVEQELLPIPVHLSSPPVFSEVSDTRSLTLWVCFVDRCMSFFSWHYLIVLSCYLQGKECTHVTIHIMLVYAKEY
jgi:hypothetical protein